MEKYRPEHKQMVIIILKEFITNYNLHKGELPENYRMINDRCQKVVTAFETGEDISEDELFQIASQIQALSRMDFEAN